MDSSDTSDEGEIIIDIPQPINYTKDKIQRILKETISPTIDFDEDGGYRTSTKKFSAGFFGLVLIILFLLQFLVFPNISKELIAFIDANNFLPILLLIYAFIAALISHLYVRNKEFMDYLDWLDVDVTDKETILTVDLNNIKSAFAYLFIKNIQKEFSDVKVSKM